MSARRNPSAFPVITDLTVRERGMTLRDYFAGQALAGLAATEGDSSPEYAYWLADEMLKARATQEKNDMSNDLVKRLRESWNVDTPIMQQTSIWMKERNEAADRIEALESALTLVASCDVAMKHLDDATYALVSAAIAKAKGGDA